MRHHASRRFWACYSALPKSVQRLADRCFAQLKLSPDYPSLRFKKVVQDYYAVRIGISYLALGVEVDGGVLWFWIGSHSGYDKILNETTRK